MDWHILHVTAETDDAEQEAMIYHPGCSVSLIWRGKDFGHEAHHECMVQSQIEAAGYYGMFSSDDRLEPGWWRIRHHIEKIVGPTWTEYDGEWTVEPFTPPNPDALALHDAAIAVHEMMSLLGAPDHLRQKITDLYDAVNAYEMSLRFAT